MLFNIMTLVVAVVSLSVSGAVALRQISMMRNANHLPIFIELTQEHRSKEFQEAYERVLSDLDDPHLTRCDVQSLPDETRAAFIRVAAFFITLGAMVAFGVVKESMVVFLFGYRAAKAWQRMEPVIMNERRVRHSRYASMFEDFVTRSGENWPPGPAYGISLHTKPNVGVILGDP